MGLTIIDGIPMMYLGDGVYASYNGQSIALTTGSHDNFNDAIYLDVDVFGNLLRFAAAVKEPNNVNQGGGDCQDERRVSGSNEKVD